MWNESQTLELKSSFSEWKEIIETLCAFVTPQNTPQNIGRREQILALLQENAEYTLKEIAQITQISRYTVKEHIEKLKQEGVIQRQGSDRKGKWIVL